MRVSLRGRMARVGAVLALMAALVLPAGVPATAADKAVLKIGTTQDLDSLNPRAFVDENVHLLGLER